MTSKKAVFITLVSTLCILFLTGCGSADIVLDYDNWLDRAHAPLSDNPTSDISDVPWYVLILGPICSFFAIASFLRGDVKSFFHWTLILIVGVGAFPEIKNLIHEIGVSWWPESFTIYWVEEVMDFPGATSDDVPMYIQAAYLATDLIVVYYSFWKSFLVMIHVVLLLYVTFSRRVNGMLVDLACILLWAFSPTMIMWFISIIGARITPATEESTRRAIIYIFYGPGITTIALLMYIIIPLSIAKYVNENVSWGRWSSKDGRDATDYAVKRFGGLRNDALALAAAFSGSIPEPLDNEGNDFKVVPSTAEPETGPDEFDLGTEAQTSGMPAATKSERESSQQDRSNGLKDENAGSFKVVEETPQVVEEEKAGSFKVVEDTRQVVEDFDPEHSESGEGKTGAIKKVSESLNDAAPLITMVDPASGTATALAGKALEKLTDKKDDQEDVEDGQYNVIPDVDQSITEDHDDENAELRGSEER